MRWDEEAFKEEPNNKLQFRQITQACGDTQESVALILLENPFLCSQIHQKANNETEFGLTFSTSSSSLTSLELLFLENNEQDDFNVFVLLCFGVGGDVVRSIIISWFHLESLLGLLMFPLIVGLAEYLRRSQWVESFKWARMFKGSSHRLSNSSTHFSREINWRFDDNFCQILSQKLYSE